MEALFLRKLHQQIASSESAVVVVNELGQILSFNHAAYRSGVREAGIDLWNLIGEGHECLLRTSLAKCLYEVKSEGCSRISPQGSSSNSSLALDKVEDGLPEDFLRNSNESIKSNMASAQESTDDVNLENVLFA